MTDIKSFFTVSKPLLETDNDDKMEKMTIEEVVPTGPAAKGKRWSDEEEASLLLEIKSDVSISDIAKTHGRTYGGITSRLREIACKMLSNGREMHYVMEETHLTENQINEALDRNQRSVTKTQTKKKETMPTAGDIASIGTDKLDVFLNSTIQPTSESKPTKLRDNMKAKTFRHTLDHKLSVEQRCALQQFEDGDNLFITGEGGTGKTLLIRHLVQSAIQH